MKRFFRAVLLRAAANWLSPSGFLLTTLTILLWSAGPRILLHVNEILVRGEGVETKINATAINLDRATNTWAQASKAQAQSVQGLVDKAQNSLNQIPGTIASVNAAVTTINAQVQHVGPLLDSTKAVTDSIPPAITRLDSDLEAIRAPIDNFGNTVNDIDAQIKSPAVTGTLSNLQAISGNAAQTTFDFQKRFHDILFPPPCRTFGCRFTRYAWPVMKDGAAFGSDVYWAGQVVGRAAKVRVVH